MYFSSLWFLLCSNLNLKEAVCVWVLGLQVPPRWRCRPFFLNTFYLELLIENLYWTPATYLTVTNSQSDSEARGFLYAEEEEKDDLRVVFSFSVGVCVHAAYLPISPLAPEQQHDACVFTWQTFWEKAPNNY